MRPPRQKPQIGHSMNTTMAILLASTNLTRQELAAALGYSLPYTSSILNGNLPISPEFRDTLAHLILRRAWPEAYEPSGVAA